jgi:probable F420-dependent oxidoreductase
VKIGVVYFCTDQTISPQRLAVEAEQRGFESVFMTDHSHIPVTRRSAYPGVYGGGELPEFYKRTHEMFIAMAMMAAVTERISIGAGIALMGQRDPIYTAKQVASLDFLSGGRVIFGVGFGWNQDEAEDHGSPWNKRFSVVRERVLAMKELWSHDIASFSGEHVELPPSWAWPKPVQRPHPPIYVGGAGPTTMKHAAEWGDCWYVVPPAGDITLDRAIPAFRALVAENGRDEASVGVAVASAPADPAVLDAYRDHGVERVSLWLDGGDVDSTLRGLDELAKLL